MTLPCTLWFFDKGKAKTKRKDQVLFIDARHTFRQVDRAHRKFSPTQIEYLANIVRVYRSEEPEFAAGGENEVPGDEPDLSVTFPAGEYADVAGLCKVATLPEIEAQGWSLNPVATSAWRIVRKTILSSPSGWKNSTKSWRC